jgi:hypothetical protein
VCRESKKKGNESKAMPVNGREVPYGCEMLRIPHFLDNQLADGGEVVNFKRQQYFDLQEIFWYSLLLESI